jgi:hypothetical protein
VGFTYNSHGGRIDVEEIGLHIGKVGSWTLTPRMGEGEARFSDLRAVLVWIQRELFLDPAYPHQITLQLGKQALRVMQDPGQRTALNGKSLIMERVTIQNAASKHDPADAG